MASQAINLADWLNTAALIITSQNTNRNSTTLKTNKTNINLALSFSINLNVKSHIKPNLPRRLAHQRSLQLYMISVHVRSTTHSALHFHVPVIFGTYVEPVFFCSSFSIASRRTPDRHAFLIGNPRSSPRSPSVSRISCKATI